MNAKLTALIEDAVAEAAADAAEMDDSLDLRVQRGADRVVIYTYASRNPNMNANGGDYDYYEVFKPVDGGVEVYPDWSADFDREDFLGSGDTVEGDVTLNELWQAALSVKTSLLQPDATATGSDGDSGDAGVMVAAAFPIGARVYMRYGETVYRAEVLEYDAERGCYTVLYHNIAYKCLMHGHAVAPERLTLAEARWQPAHVLAAVAAA